MGGKHHVEERASWCNGCGRAAPAYASKESTCVCIEVYKGTVDMRGGRVSARGLQGANKRSL